MKNKISHLVHSDVCCPRCHRQMTAVLMKDAGFVRMTDRGYEDGNEVLAFSCMRDDCLDGAYDEHTVRKAA